MKEVIMQVASYSSDYPKAPIYVADLVRCKECKWQDIVTDDEEGTSYYMCGVWANATDEDVFCSYGEREGE